MAIYQDAVKLDAIIRKMQKHPNRKRKEQKIQLALLLVPSWRSANLKMDTPINVCGLHDKKTDYSIQHDWVIPSSSLVLIADKQV